MTTLRISNSIGAVLIIVGIAMLSPAHANILCERVSCLQAQDINGIRLDMTVQQVARLLPNGLIPIGGGDFQAVNGDTSYDFGFTALGHLYRIDSRQILGRFLPDREFGLHLTAKLVAKYGPAEGNQLPGGPASWDFVENNATAQGAMLTQRAESLSAILNRGYDAPVTLDLKLMDLRILRRDQTIMNATPLARAREHIEF